MVEVRRSVCEFYLGTPECEAGSIRQRRRPTRNLLGPWTYRDPSDSVSLLARYGDLEDPVCRCIRISELPLSMRNFKCNWRVRRWPGSCEVAGSQSALLTVRPRGPGGPGGPGGPVRWENLTVRKEEKPLKICSNFRLIASKLTWWTEALLLR